MSTPSGRIALTQVELNYLQDYLDAHDRPGFYMAYYNMTGSEQPVLQAQISSFSEGPGGSAYAANAILQAHYGPMGQYLGIYVISQEVAQNALNFIQLNIAGDGTGYIDAATMLQSAAALWDSIGQGNQFPGNLLQWPLHARQITGSQVDEESLWSQILDVLDNATTPQQVFNELFTTGALTTLVSSVLGPALFGKGDRWDRTLSVLVDAMNHFGARHHMVLDDRGPGEPQRDIELLSVAPLERSMRPRAWSGPLL